MSKERNAPDQPLLVVDGARHGYGGREVLRDVSLAIRPGEILVLLGPNGAGKSTLVRAIAGRLAIAGGTVRVAGRDPAHDPEARRLTGIVPQQIALFEKLTAAENLQAFGRLMGLARRRAGERAGELLDQVGLAGRAGDRVASLSGGMRRRVNIAAALMHEPRLLILDEPTVGVDVAARSGLAQLLRDLRAGGLAILLTTHDLDEAESLADRVAVMVAGRIMDTGEPGRLVAGLFGSRRELTIGLAAGTRAGNLEPLRQVLAAGGLGSRADGRVWSGLVEGSPDSFEGLMRLSTQSDGAIEDVRVRRPGLEAVLLEYVRRAGAGDGKGRD